MRARADEDDMGPPNVKAPAAAVPKRTLSTIFEESVQVDRKLTIHGPDQIRPDSRYKITEVHADHVVIQLLGDDLLVLPYTAISSLRVQATGLVIRYA
jgi:hypothetical protein